jgi:hypothetical protein
MKTLLITLSLLLITNNSYANPVEDFGEISAMYIGTCSGLEHLKKNYCYNSSSEPTLLCINRALDLLPSKLRNEFAPVYKEQLATISSESSNGVDKGFAKTLNLVKHDKEKACFGYASSLNTMKYEKYEYLKKISRQIQ